jgi:hypothetical protein
MQLSFQDSSIDLYTGTSGSAVTTRWIPSGAEVSLIAEVTAGTSGTAIDTFAKATYRTAKYLIQATSGTDYESVEALVIHDGTTASISAYNWIDTNGTLGDLSVSISGSNVVLTYTALANGTEVRVKKDYIVV